jgi:hypothetical protein
MALLWLLVAKEIMQHQIVQGTLLSFSQQPDILSVKLALPRASCAAALV